MVKTSLDAEAIDDKPCSILVYSKALFRGGVHDFETRNTNKRAGQATAAWQMAQESAASLRFTAVGCV